VTKVSEPFHLRKAPAGHAPTNYDRWFNLTAFSPALYSIALGMALNHTPWPDETVYHVTRMVFVVLVVTNNPGWKNVTERDMVLPFCEISLSFIYGQSSTAKQTPLWVRYEYVRPFRAHLDYTY